MKHPILKTDFLLIPLLLFLLSCQSKERSLSSPDGRLKLRFFLDAAQNNALQYQLHYKNREVLKPSTLGFFLENEEDWSRDFAIVSAEVQEINQTWKPLYGERAVVPDHYREMKIVLAKKASKNPQLALLFRLYDEGLAFRYIFLEKADSLQIKEEKTAFTFTADLACWSSSRAQSEIRRQKISEITDARERPLVLELGDSLYAAIGEAALVDFARMKWRRDSLQDHALKADLSGKAIVKAPYSTPWRYLLVGEQPGDLLERNYLLQNLNAPNALEDVSWIKPGKVIREVTLTTQGGLACVDFAAENGLQYVEFDAGWYGHEYEDDSDARTVTVDPKRSPGPLDLPYIIDYANSKEIGIILYVNRRAMEKQLDEILPLYQSWGIKGVKYGFVQVGSQQWTTWLHEAVRKAARHKLMVDIHDEYRPTGFSRAYPNLMTQEGIRGDEESPSTQHTLTTLFTRMIAGAGDNTNCYYAPRVTEKMGGHAAQLAKAVLLYSPWQFLYWYDRPPASPHKKGGVGASTGIIGEEKELDFFKALPTVWEDTKVLEGAIGRYATIARKSEGGWFIGSLTAEEREVEIALDFLDTDQKYEAKIYLDDPEKRRSTGVRIEEKTVEKGAVLKYALGADRGMTIMIWPTS